MRHFVGPICGAAICASLAGCGPAPTPQDQTTVDAATSTAPTPSPDELAKSERPAEQVHLEALLKKLNDAEEGSGNPINDDENFTTAYQAFCSEMQKDGVLKDWTAQIRDIYPANPGDSTNNKPSVHLITPGGLEALQDLDYGSQLMQVVKTLHEGDYVKFTVNVTHVEKGRWPDNIYHECHDFVEGRSRGSQVNHFLEGNVLNISPIS